ncbi:MFS transporter [Streptomyces sp. NBC_01498]|uniref:hypothetical protein n=1 Tax=Streptomyces sp. NBC_01498 TaxID=2975870 RepID=UPI002E7B2C78|nr:hypothetical protein [Streptomyces sp. NBC_01498]WTL24007.1 MFS transporter [Streptomyces sp. NBC_01498]
MSTAAPPQVNGRPRPALPELGDWRPVKTTGTATVWEKPVPAPDEPAVQTTPAAQPAVDHVALAEAEAIRQRAAAEADAARIKAESEAAAEAKAVEIKAEAEAEKQRIANERAAMKLEADKATHAKRLADLEAQRAASEAAAAKTRKDADDEAEREADRAGEQKRSADLWKWGARSIYAVGLVIAAPIQFLAFWDEKRPFLVAAPALLEGLALVLAFGAAWAVANRRDVTPYRIGIMIGALIAAGINLWHGVTDIAIGLNAGLIGAIASLGGPIVLMAYEHGIAQQADGIPSRRERRAARKAAAAEAKAKEKVLRDKRDAEHAAAAAKDRQESRAKAEQERRDADRKESHPDVWRVADAMRSARGSEHVTEQIWADAWYRVTGSKHVGITADIEAQTRAAQARMKAATECPVGDSLSQVDSQTNPRPKKDPNTPDGRRFNGGIPPLRTPGDTAPYSDAARKAASLAARAEKESK